MTKVFDSDTIVAEIKDGVFLCTKEGQIIQTNAAFADLFGLDRNEMKSRNLSKDLVERPLDWAALVSLLDQGSVILDYEMKFKCADGSPVFCSVSASILKSDKGEHIGVLGVVRDITTRKTIENELRDKAFRTDVMNKIAKIASADNDIRKGLLFSVASELQKITNFDELALGISEPNARHVEVLVPDASDPSAAKSLGKVPFEGSIVEALRFGPSAILVDKDAARKPYAELSAINADAVESMVAVPLTSRGMILGSLQILHKRASEYDGDTVDLLQMVADQISGLIDSLILLSTLEAKLKLQDALVSSGLAIQKTISTEQIYAAIATHMGDVVPYKELSFYMVDWHRKMVYPVFAAGAYSSEVMTDPGTLDEGIVGSVAKSGRAELLDDVDADPRSAQIPGVPADHEAMLALPLIGSENVLGVLELYRPSGELFTVADLEAGKLFAQQATVSLENAALLSKLQEANKEIAMLNDLMFHDINNFNFATLNYIELMASKKDLPADLKEHMDKSLQLIRQTAALIDNVKKLTKIGTLNAKDFKSIDLSDVLRKTISGLENSWPGRSISVKLNVPESCSVMANPLVEELFVNLLSNSVKYDPHEDVEIDVDCEKISEEGRPIWRVCISDRGHGIPDDMKPLLFEKYVRLKAEPLTHGTGLGLSICRALVDKFGGRIWVEDRVPGKSELGARFCLTLPASKG
jgi:PAS domain S-box-containing protein